MILAAIIFLIFKTNIQPALANNRSLNAQGLMGQNFAQGLAKAQQAMVTPTPHITDVRMDLARTLISFSSQPEALKADIYKQGLTLMGGELDKLMAEHPLEINAYLVSSQFAAVGGNFAKAEEMLDKAQSLSPQRQQVAYMRTRVKFARRDFQGAIDLLNKTIADDPNIADSYWYLSLVYNELGDKQKSFDELQIALDKGKGFTQTPEITFAADSFKRFGDFENAAKYYEMALGQANNNPQILLALSEVYALMGNKEKAREMADRAGLYNADALKKAKMWLK